MNKMTTQEKYPETFENTSGKYIKHPFRLSDCPEFYWAPKERVKIIKEDSNGLILRNLDYCGNNRILETSYITTELFNFNFLPLH